MEVVEIGWFLLQILTWTVMKKFVSRQTSEKGNPRFVPVSNEFIHEVRWTETLLVTVQLVEMD